MRDLLRGFADEGGTVFLSSHLLNEIERVADDVVVIGRGQIVAHGTKAELVGGSGTFVRAVGGCRAQPQPLVAGHASFKQRLHRGG
jgi:ABC-2 type transport system ATP-binding protein